MSRNKTSRARKTSKVPTRIYKYGLQPPTVNADLVEQAFVDARIYYNKLITIENIRRARYRTARARYFPRVAALENEEAKLASAVEQARVQINAVKADARARAVDPELAAQVAQLKAEQKAVRAALRIAKQPIAYVYAEEAVPQLERKLAKVDTAKAKTRLEKQLDQAHGLLRTTLPPTAAEREQLRLFRIDAARFRDEANEAIKALRPTLYWGTYLLVEAAAAQAACDTNNLDYNTEPPHRLKSRIGVQLQKGIPVSALADDTRLQIGPMPTFRKRQTSEAIFARGAWARTTLKIRIGSKGRQPIWGEFPMVMHRPLPDDARIMWAYVTRRPDSVRVPWRYELCLVCESRKFERQLPGIQQEGTTTINFGWRFLDGDLRVATVNNDAGTPFEIRLPKRILDGFAQLRRLDQYVDNGFNAAKSELTSWIAGHENAVSEDFKATFATLPAWRSSWRLAQWVWYWREHRFAGDEEIFAAVVLWKDRYRHLGDWGDHLRRRLLNWRNNFYREWAKRLATTSARIVADDFEISSVARKPTAEKKTEGGPTANRNRTIASVGAFRSYIEQAGAKYHCEVLAAPAANNTRRCNVCGELYEWEPARELVHTCPGDGSIWDQDVNNTDNLHDRHASGEVVSLVTPAKRSENGELDPSETHSRADAREKLRKYMKTK